MRTRTIMTVALLSVAGCGTSGTTRQSSAGKPSAAAPATTPAAAPAPAPPSTPAVATTVMAVPAPVTASSAPATTLGREQLQQLAYELRGSDPSQVTARLAHFRPLCDAEGFPLVGNAATKSADPGPVASFCAHVRGSR